MSTKKPTALEEKLARVRATRAEAAPTSPADTAADPLGSSEPAGPTPPSSASARPAGGFRRRSNEPPYAERVPRATFYIDRSILEQLDAVCRERGFNKSEFVREAIVRHIVNNG